MNKTQKKAYIENLRFNLKDFYKTLNKYMDYKNIDFNKFLEDNKQEIQEFLKYLCDNITNGLQNTQTSNFIYRQQNLNFNEKMSIRELKIMINHVTMQINKEFIKNCFEYNNINLNPNNLKNFSIKFYLKFYDTINQEMKNALIETIENY